MANIISDGKICGMEEYTILLMGSCILTDSKFHEYDYKSYPY